MSGATVPKGVVWSISVIAMLPRLRFRRGAKSKSRRATPRGVSLAPSGLAAGKCGVSRLMRGKRKTRTRCSINHPPLLHTLSSSSSPIMLASRTMSRSLLQAGRRGLHSTSATAALGSLAAARAKDVESKWRGTSTSGGTTKNYVDGQFVDSKTDGWIEVPDPVSTT